MNYEITNLPENENVSVHEGVIKTTDANNQTVAFKYTFAEESYATQEHSDMRFGLFNELVFSRLAKTLGIRAADNNLAKRGNKYGIVSPWFLGENEVIKPMKLRNRNKGEDEELAFKYFQQSDVGEILRQCRSLPLDPTFEKNFIETYLFSVLMSNWDHPSIDLKGKNYIFNNISITRDKITEMHNMVTYHDFEGSTFSENNDYSNDCSDEVRQGYKSNIATLRQDHGEVLNNFLANLEKVNAEEICDVTSPHLDVISPKFARDKYTKMVSKGLKEQISFMTER